MPRAPKLNPEICARIQARKRKGATYATLEKEFALSKGTIGKALKTKVPADLLKTAMAAIASEQADAEKEAERAADPGALLSDLEDIVARSTQTKADRLAGAKLFDELREVVTAASDGRSTIERVQSLIRTLETLVTKAVRNKDELGQITRLISALRSMMELALKLEPPTPPDPNNQPDMVDAAAKARALLIERIVRRATAAQANA